MKRLRVTRSRRWIRQARGVETVITLPERGKVAVSVTSMERLLRDAGYEPEDKRPSPPNRTIW